MESSTRADADGEHTEHRKARARAAALLPRLVAAEAEHGLPVVEWELSHRGWLAGVVCDGGAESARAWADYFGAGVHEVPDLSSGLPHPHVATGLDDYRGVTVVVRSRV